MNAKRFKHIDMQVIPLGNDLDTPTAERLPEPTWIYVTSQEYERMFKNEKVDRLRDNID